MPRAGTLRYVVWLARLGLALPILACLLTAWILAAIIAGIWMGITLFSSNDPLDFDE